MLSSSSLEPGPFASLPVELPHAHPVDTDTAWKISHDVRSRMTQLHYEVEQVISHFRLTTPSGPDKRRLPRHAYPCAVDMWPVQQGRPTGERIVVIGKNMSLGGLDFFHREPLAQRYVIAALEQAPSRFVFLLTELHWCRFLRDGWYDGGGRFVKVVADPRGVAYEQL